VIEHPGQRKEERIMTSSAAEVMVAMSKASVMHSFTCK
jgi:hypothetical protein